LLAISNYGTLPKPVFTLSGKLMRPPFKNKDSNPEKIIRLLGQKEFRRDHDYLEQLIKPLNSQQIKACFKAITELLMRSHLHHIVRLDGLALYRVLSGKAPETVWPEISPMIESKLDHPEEFYFASQLLSPKMIPLFHREDQEKIYRYLLEQLSKGEIEKGLIEGGEPAKCLVQLQNILPDKVKEEIFVILSQGLSGSWWHAGFCTRFAIELANIFTEEQTQILLKDIVTSVIENNSFSARDELEFYLDKLPLSWYSTLIEVLKETAANEQKKSDAIYWIDKIGNNPSLDNKLTEKANQTVRELLTVKT
jgi:hypothetical protein